MKTLDTSRYYKIVGLAPGSSWVSNDRPAIGAIVQVREGNKRLPHEEPTGLWRGWFRVMKPSQWDWPPLGQNVFICGVKLHLIPRTQQEKIDELRRNATAARS